ncbi:MAG: hypothetical protein AAFP70_10715 [Calditrichota bacterium]
MTPFHPKFRQLLLSDKEHQRRGLTAGLLQEYEALETQYYYLRNYPPADASVEIYTLTQTDYSDIEYALQGNNDWGILGDVLGAIIDRPFSGALSLLSHVEDRLIAWNDVQGPRIFNDHRALILQEITRSAESFYAPNAPSLDDLLLELNQFKSDFLVNYGPIHQSWIELQKRSARKRYLDTSSGSNFFGFFLSLFLIFFPRKPKDIRVQSPSQGAK